MSKRPRTVLIDLDQLSGALTVLGNWDLTGPITFVMIRDLINAIQAAVIQEPERDECHSATPPKSSSEKSETEQ